MIQENVPLAPYTTFKVGGLARYFAEASTVEEIKELCSWARSAVDGRVFALGGGSNVLVSDSGFGGLVIRFCASDFKISEDKIFAEAGASLGKIVFETASVGLSGLEWSVGIPGTIGGAICDNTGAFAREMSELAESVEVLSLEDLSIKQFNKTDCGFSYRDSIFKKTGNFIILSAVLKLTEGNTDDVRERIKNYAVERASSFIGAGQKCAGCFFKNVEWSRLCQENSLRKSDFRSMKEEVLQKFPELSQFSNKPKISAAFLIESVGLKGEKIGGAAVSDKHTNFLVNTGNASAKDVRDLSNLVKEKILKKYGFNLEEEVVLVGFEK